MGDIARCSLGTLSDSHNEEQLYREFGKNAELLIDHAWGDESATIADIKNYHASEHGIYASQVLMRPYTYTEGQAVLRGMVNNLTLELVARHVVTDQLGIRIDYDANASSVGTHYQGAVTEDYYGRQVPKPAHTKVTLAQASASQHELGAAYQQLYQQVVNRQLMVRRVTVMANHLVDEQQVRCQPRYQQTNLFENPEVAQAQERDAQRKRERDGQLQRAILKLQRRSGNKNVVIRLADLKPSSTTIERNEQIGGHRA